MTRQEQKRINQSKEVPDGSDRPLDTEAEKICAKANLVYDKEDKSLDLGRMRATDYKYNKLIHLPRPENVQRES